MSDSKKHVILVVDDSRSVREYLKATLKKADCDCVEASSGAEGLETLKKEKPDLAIIDMLMPGMNGLELATLVRADPETEKTPIIMLTSQGTARDKMEGYNSGVNVFLQKSVEPAQLMDRVFVLLKRFAGK